MQQQFSKQPHKTNIAALKGLTENTIEHQFDARYLMKLGQDFSLDVLALKYLSATMDLQAILEAHNSYFKMQPTLHLLTEKLMEIFMDAAGGNTQALLDASNGGETILRAILDLLENPGRNGEPKIIYRLHSELKSQLQELYEKYYKTKLKV